MLRVRATRATGRAVVGAAAGTAVGAGILHLGGDSMAAAAALGLLTLLGGVVGSRERNDTCATCESSLPLEAKECVQCDAPIGGEIAHPRERAAGEEQLRQGRIAARKKAEAEAEAESD